MGRVTQLKYIEIMKTTDFLKHNVNEHHFSDVISRCYFSKKELLTINDLIPNQEVLDEDCLKMKIKGKNLTTPYVIKYNGRLILIDGHHTVISKKINGQNKVYCKIYNKR